MLHWSCWQKKMPTLFLNGHINVLYKAVLLCKIWNQYGWQKFIHLLDLCLLHTMCHSKYWQLIAWRSVCYYLYYCLEFLTRMDGQTKNALDSSYKNPASLVIFRQNNRTNAIKLFSTVKTIAQMRQILAANE